MSRVRAGLANLDQVAVSEQTPGFRYARRPSWGWMAAAAGFILVLVGVLYWKPAPKNDSLTQVRPPDHDELPAPQPLVESPETVQQPPEPETPAPPIEAPVPKQPAVAQGSKVVAPQVTAPQRVEAPPAGNDPSPSPVPVPVIAKAPPGGEVVEKPKTLEDAVRNGMAYLRTKAGVFAKETKSDELLLWTVYQGGLPESDPEFQTALKAILEKKLEKTYNVSLQAMLLEDLDRVKHQKRLAQCAQFLLDNQCANGQWAYGDPSIFVEAVVLPPLPPKFKGQRKVPLTKKREGPAAGDNSNTMYALLGLRACHDAGIVLPGTSVELAAKWWRETQTRSPGIKAPAVGPEGWCYGRHDHKAYGSMTAGGVGSLAICDYILGRDWKKDREVACGMEWLAKNFSVAYNPGPYEHANFEENSQHQYYYYLYALERAAILTGAEQIGPHFWFAKGSQALIDAQRADGSWRAAAGGNELTDTCFAVLTLRKATRALIDVATLSPTKK